MKTPQGTTEILLGLAGGHSVEQILKRKTQLRYSNIATAAADGLAALVALAR